MFGAVAVRLSRLVAVGFLKQRDTETSHREGERERERERDKDRGA